MDEIDAAVSSWIEARTRDEVVAAFEEAEAAIAPVYDALEILDDPQLAAIGAIASVPDEDLGRVLMSNVVARLAETPGEIRWAGRAHGADTAEVLTELGVDGAALAALRAEGAI